MNVQRLLIPTIALSLLSGCASIGIPGLNREPVAKVEVQTRAVERAPLRLADPDPVKFRDLEWIVITPENIEKVWADLKAKNTDLVLFALTDDGYESLALDFAAIRRYIVMQRDVAQKYREYYEPKPADDKK